MPTQTHTHTHKHTHKHTHRGGERAKEINRGGEGDREGEGRR